MGALFDDVVVDIVSGFDEGLSTILLTSCIGIKLIDVITGATSIGTLIIDAISIGTINDAA